MQRLYRPARSIFQLLRPCDNVRSFASKRSSRVSKAWPRSPIQREHSLSNDPEFLVRTAHEKERFAFRYALERKDFTAAYKVYVEQRDLPILSGAEVTSLVQLISADALLRKLNGVDQPESLQDVFWTIIDDVREMKVAGQTILWAHAIDALITWEKFSEAQELWTHLQSLPNRTTTDRNDAQCIDSRVYGSAVKLYVALNDMSKVQELYDEAMTERKLTASLMLEQSMIAALFQDGRIGDAYKAMDRAIREQRRALRPAFFNAMMALALDAEAVGVATEIFMKACKIQMSPAAAQVTRLLSALGRSRTDSLSAVLTVFKHYQDLNNGQLPIEHVNSVISAIFNSARDGIAATDVLARVHQLLKDMQEIGLRSTPSTINILLAGYVQLGQFELAHDLMARAELNDVSYRTIFKSLTASSDSKDLSRVREIWAAFAGHRRQTNSHFVLRDLQMVMRSAFKTSPKEAAVWIQEIMDENVTSLPAEHAAVLEAELDQHVKGKFVFGKVPKPNIVTNRSMRWLAQDR